ncbi:hypothetical protein [uncultured Tateyamaria sp.]|uniref:hypothetical protein n=1 Tax=uncultured Tateyamaria sp. TaxID=455651 RepID=UPI00262F2415|nr:hypothetical protein [uncultured Tateyamaria sp.]
MDLLEQSDVFRDTIVGLFAPTPVFLFSTMAVLLAFGFRIRNGRTESLVFGDVPTVLAIVVNVAASAAFFFIVGLLFVASFAGADFVAEVLVSQGRIIELRIAFGFSTLIALQLLARAIWDGSKYNKSEVDQD